MNAPIWLRPVPSCCVVWNAEDGGLQPISTTGRQDKRPDAQGVYGVVVIRVFARCALGHSAVPKVILLILRPFHRATPVFGEARA